MWAGAGMSALETSSWGYSNVRRYNDGGVVPLLFSGYDSALLGTAAYVATAARRGGGGGASKLMLAAQLQQIPYIAGHTGQLLADGTQAPGTPLPKLETAQLEAALPVPDALSLDRPLI